MACEGLQKVDQNENYDKLIEKKGVNVVERKLAAHDTLIITQGNTLTVKESSSYRNIEIVFELGVTFNYRLPDGTEHTDNWKLEEKKFVRNLQVDNGKELVRKLQVHNGKELNNVREIKSVEMVQTYEHE